MRRLRDISAYFSGLQRSCRRYARCFKSRIDVSLTAIHVIPIITIIATSIAAAAQEPAAPEPKVFEVVARRFAFEPATIEVVEGDRVRLLVRSADGPHGVEITAFKVKKAVPRAKPGDAPIAIEFVATAAGEYPILCSEYCGSGHKEMTGALVVRAKPKGDQ